MNKAIIPITIFVLFVGSFVLFARHSASKIDWSKKKKIKDPLKKIKSLQ